MSIDLYAFDTPNGRKISVALEEMGLPYTVKVVDITRGEQHAPAFEAISPNRKIPAIVDPQGPGGQPISVFESGAILIYLGEKSGKFWPADPVARVAVLEWLMFQMGGFGPMPGQVHHFVALKDEAATRLRAEALHGRDAASVRCDGQAAGDARALCRRAVDRRLRHPRLGLAARAPPGGPGRLPERAALVPRVDGATGRAARFCRVAAPPRLSAAHLSDTRPSNG